MKAAVGLATVLLLGMVVGFSVLVAPLISEQANTLADEIPASISKIKGQLMATE